jgi:hypothetical protein
MEECDIGGRDGGVKERKKEGARDPSFCTEIGQLIGKVENKTWSVQFRGPTLFSFRWRTPK